MEKSKATPDVSFDVTCVIGSVVLDGTGDKPPHVAAFELIALHDAPGEYIFPAERGGVCRVFVQFDN